MRINKIMNDRSKIKKLSSVVKAAKMAHGFDAVFDVLIVSFDVIVVVFESVFF